MIRSISIVALALCLTAAAVHGQPTFYAPNGSMTIGTTQTFPVRIDSFESIMGFAYGLCPSGSSPVSVTAAVPGSVFDAIGQPDFFQEELEPFGFVGSHTVGCVISFFGLVTLPTGTDLELVDVTFAAGAPGSVELCFCDTLGSPPVSTVYVVSGASIPPTQICGTVTVEGLCSPVTNLTCSLENGVQVVIDWDNPQGYSFHVIYRNGVEIGSISGDDSSFVDISPEASNVYEIESICPAGGPEVATCSIELQSAGDANGDGNIDLGDAIYLLNFLVGSGSPPVYVDCP